jgi:hypothetical protein
LRGAKEVKGGLMRRESRDRREDGERGVTQREERERES